MSVMLATVVDGASVLAIALVAVTLMRRRSAAARHAVLTVSIVCALLMPALELTLPQTALVEWGRTASVTWEFTDVVQPTSLDSVGAAQSVGASVDWGAMLIWAWAVASTVMFALLLLDLARLARLRSMAVPVTGPWRERADVLARDCGIRQPVELLESSQSAALMAYGVWRVGVILPASARDWVQHRRDIVLVHELAHIRRRDAVTQLAAELLRCIQPFNPLVWLAVRRLRQESELACDDAVLCGGVAAPDYATHLLEVARQLSHRRTVWASAPAIAHPSTLERRVVAMLDARRNRTTMSRIGWASVAGMALALSLPIAALSLTAPVAQTAVDLSQDPLATAPPATPAPTAAPMPQPKTAASASTRQTATITGQVVDQSGGAIPGAKATLANSQGGDERTAISNASGRYTFDGLPPAEYQLTVQLVGFRSARVVTQAGPGARVETPVTLQIGGLVETINVRCSSSFSILDALFPVLHAQTPIRIGGQIHAPRVITRVSPVCPAGAVTENTIVIAEGVIGADGAIDSLKILRPQTDALDDAVLKALPQWRFTPTLLNGRPVEVTITVTVNFQVS